MSFAGAIPFAPVTSLLVPDDYKRTELAWRLSTKEDNPVLRVPRVQDLRDGALPPTGFEPYFLGIGLTPKQTLLTIAEIGAKQLDFLTGRHQENDSYVGRLLSILEHGHLSAHEPQRARDVQALAECDAILGGLTRWLGRQADGNDLARRYRTETHELVAPFVSTLTYVEPTDQEIVEHYELPEVSRAGAAIAPEWKDLPSFRLQRGWRFMLLLGDRLGNAPVRFGLQGRWQRLPLQFRY